MLLWLGKLKKVAMKNVCVNVTDDNFISELEMCT
jgi:hypothetical protein